MNSCHLPGFWTNTSIRPEEDMDQLLQGSSIDTLIVTGGETDVCVLATVLGGIDRGYRVVVVSDALCSSTDDSTTRCLPFIENASMNSWKLS
jgi:nicotinamidase-related amidase